MDSQDSLLETLPVSNDHDTGTAQALLDPIKFRLLSRLAQARDPVAWLNQLAIALDAAGQGEAWHEALPGDLRDHAQAIGDQLGHWQEVLETTLLEQARDRADLLALGSLPSTYPRRLLEQHQQQNLQRLFKRFGQAAPSSIALATWRATQSSRLQAWRAVQEILSEGASEWRVHRASLSANTLAVMQAEAAMQVEEGLLAEQISQRLLNPLPDAPVAWLELRIGGQGLPGAWVLVDERDWSSGRRDMPLLLWLHGEGGGMVFLEDRQTLTTRLGFTLREGGLPISTLLPEGELELELVMSAGGFEGLFNALFDQWESGLGDEAQTSAMDERRLQLARAALAIPADTCRQAALAQAERQWQMGGLVEHMPQWALVRDEAERRAYAGLLVDYHRSALTLESWLQTHLPDFSEWAGDLLKARIRQDLGIDIARDEILLWRPDPTLNFNLPYLSSTVAELAVEGFDPHDEEEIRRLDMARWQIEGIEANYLARVLPELDPLRLYEEKLRKALDPAVVDDAERLRRPYRLELQLLASSEHWKGALTEEGARMLGHAALADSVKKLQDAGMALHWLVLTTAQELGQSLEGIGALVSDTGHTLIYLPGAPQAYRLIERASLAAALETLVTGIRTRSDMVTYVAQRCASDPVGVIAYLNQAAQRSYDGYLTSRPALNQTLIDLQLTGRCNLLMDQARAQGRSQASIHRQHRLDSHVRHVGYLRAALSILPGVGNWQSVSDIYDGAEDLADAWRTGGGSLALSRGTFMVAMGVADLLLTVSLVGSAFAAVRRLVRRMVQRSLARRSFAGYAAGHRLSGAHPLAGADANTWLLDGKQYIWQDGLAYEVYRRGNEATLRLRATATRRYEAPIRQDGARWVMHGDVGLRGGGGKLTEAEQLFADWGPRSQHPPLAGSNRTGALAHGREVLARYSFFSPSQSTEFALSYIQDGIAPGWASRYLREAPWHGGSTTVGDGWQSVRWNIGPGDRVTDIHGGRVRVGFAGSRTELAGVRLYGAYYPVLAGDHFGDLLYVVPRGRMPHSLVELDALIEQGMGPVRVELAATAADAPRVLGGFSQTFGQRLATRFPTMSDGSRRALGETLYRAADDSDAALTHTRMRRLVERFDDLALEPLDEMSIITLRDASPHLTPWGGESTLRRILDGQEPPLRQLSWHLQAAEHTAMRTALGGLEPEPVGGLLRDILTARGYEVLRVGSLPERHLLVFIRPGHRHIHILLQHCTVGRISLQGAGGLVLFSDVWVDSLIASTLDLQLAASLRSARRQGTLRLVLGGMHLDGPGRTTMVWERVAVAPVAQAQLPLIRNWRHELRPLGAIDRELLHASGMYGTSWQPTVQGVRIEGQLLPVFSTDTSSRIVLSRSPGLSSPLSFEALESCLRERFGEQPWLTVSARGRWTVRRPLFPAALDEYVRHARPGLGRRSALNAAHHVFERAVGSDHARLLYLENVLSSWANGTSAVDELADPLLLLGRYRPSIVQGETNWGLRLALETPGSAPMAFYLRATDHATQNLVAVVSGTTMREHALGVIDGMLVRYGLTPQHRAGNVALYYQALSDRMYLVALATSERSLVEFAAQEGRALLSDTWLQHWRQTLPADVAQRLQLAEANGRLVRLTAVLRLEEGPYLGQVAIQRLADF